MYSIYKVEEKETLSDVAGKFGVDVDTLKQLNGMKDSTSIFPGSYLLVPMKRTNQDTSMYNTYVVKSGDSVYGIATTFGVPYETVLKINGLKENEYIYPNQQLLIPKQNSNMYMTTGNETIQDLYEKYKDKWDEFLKRNQKIYVVADQMIQE